MDGGASGRRRRRSHSAEFKAQVLRACAQPGVSVAAVALAHGLNANLVRRWLNGRGVERAGGLASGEGQSCELAPTTAAATFLSVQLDQRPPPPDIRLELRRGTTVVVVHWPLQDAAGCGAWLREWLR